MHSGKFVQNELEICVSNRLLEQIAKQWNAAITTGNCLTAVPMYTTMASITIIFDVLMYGSSTSTNEKKYTDRVALSSMLTPFPMLLKSQLQTRKKVIILGLFSLGTFITIIQIIRILTIKSLSNAIDSSHLIMWSMVENNLGIIVASIPPLSPLVRSVRERSSANRSKGGKDGRGMSYGLHTIGTSNRDREGHMVLGSGHDIDSKDERMVVVSGGQVDNSSEENIILVSDQRIYQKTEIVITDEPKWNPGA